MKNNKNVDLIKKSLMWISLIFMPQTIFIALIKLQIVERDISSLKSYTHLANIVMVIFYIILFFSYLNMVLRNKNRSLKSVKTNFIILALSIFVSGAIDPSCTISLSLYSILNYIILFVVFCMSFFINTNLQKYRDDLYKVIKSFLIITLLITFILLIITSIQLIYSLSFMDSMAPLIKTLKPISAKIFEFLSLSISSWIIVMDVNRLKFKNIEKESKEDISKYSIYSALSIYFGITFSFISYYIFNSDMDK